MALTFGSLFAGVGGFDMGFEQAGWDCKFQVEWDKHCQQILNKHWPDIPKWGDVSGVNGAEIPPVDCIIFGSPCQDLSQAGRRKGLEGERSGLFHEAVRIIKEMRYATNGTFPRWTVWENVTGALSSNNGQDFATVINEMAKAGAHLQEYALLDASKFGIPQRRRRVFLVSCFDPATAEQCPDPLLPVAKSLPGDTGKSIKKREETTRATGDSLVYTKSRRAQSVNDHETWVEGEIGPTLNQFDVGDVRATTVVVEEPIFFQAHMSGEARVKKDVMHSLSANMGTGGNNTPLVATQSMSVRRLTPLECERLMGWPDNHTRWKADGTEQADSHRYRQCGNGVATPVAKWIAQQIRKVEYAKR
jgi:DNA (cytosine-5)-methyltransferase 1